MSDPDPIRAWWDSLGKDQSTALAKWRAGDYEAINQLLPAANRDGGSDHWAGHLYAGPKVDGEYRMQKTWSLDERLHKFLNARYGEDIVNHSLSDYADYAEAFAHVVAPESSRGTSSPA